MYPKGSKAKINEPPGKTYRSRRTPRNGLPNFVFFNSLNPWKTWGVAAIKRDRDPRIFLFIQLI